MQDGGECQRCGVMESELRKAKRAQEKMTALHHRLRKDILDSGGDVQ